MKKGPLTSMTKTVGVVSDGYHIGNASVTIRFTLDPAGSSLSLSDDKHNLILVPYRAVEDLVKETIMRDKRRHS